jgi:class 3 adenylate cyclase
MAPKQGAAEARFGLHCAKALVGHFGARDRMNYTAIGDAINLASRLEGLNKQYGSSIIASDAIVDRAKKAFNFRLLDVAAVKGKSDPITIYSGRRAPWNIAVRWYPLTRLHSQHMHPQISSTRSVSLRRAGAIPRAPC